MLEGVRIIELAGGLAGPVAGLMLAEMGADVLKIEPPGGDLGRSETSFATWNRSKQSLELDVDSPAGLARLRDLLGQADVLVHDLPPSRAAALKLDDASLAQAWPQLISCSVLGYPTGHADAERPTDELLMQARNALLDEQDGYRPGPIVWRYPIGGYTASQLVAAGVLTRLIMRLESGRGGGVHTSLLQGMLGPMALVWSRVEKGMLSVPMPKPPGVLQQQMYQCSDGWLQIMDPTGKLDFASLPLMWQVASELDLHVDDLEHRKQAFRERPMEAWLKALRAVDTAVEPCFGLGETLLHPEAGPNAYVVEVDDPVWGKTRQAATPIHFLDPVKVHGPAPKPNQHADRPWRAERRPVPAGTGVTRKLPLEGLKVVDFGAFLAGPMAPSMMGDLGADVIKVEPVTGDRMRFMLRYFHAAARNKRSLAVDLRKPEGQEILGRLARWADVAHHNMRVKAAAKMGLDEAGLRKLNPNLVFGYVSAYGLKGERADWPGYDSVFEALGGWEVENAGGGNAPVFSRAGCMDVLCAFNSLVGTLAALYDWKANGRAAGAETSLMGVTCLTQGETLITADGAIAAYPRLDKDQTGTGPLNRIYQSKDGWVAVAATKDQVDALCTAFGASGIDALEAAASDRSEAELLDRLAAQGVAAETVIDGDGMNRLFDYAPHRDSGLIVGVPHTQDGMVEQPGAYWLFSDAELQFKRSSPLLGEHTDEILAELGYSGDEIASLRQKGVVA